MSILFQIAERALNRPLLIHPDKAPLILDVIAGRIKIDAGSLAAIAAENIAGLPEDARAAFYGPKREASRFAGSQYDSDPASGRDQRLPYKRTAEGVAIISIIGALVNRGAWIGANSGLVSYEGISQQVAHAVADPKTKAAILDIESPGGEAVGAMETADAVRALAKKKPVVAVVNGMAASAAYAIASAATKIVTTPSGISGSIGTIYIHADFSRQLDREGVTPTMIFAGAHKADGNPFEPLPEAVRSDIQADADHFYDLFVETVARGRKGLSAKAIRATEARCFIGSAAVDAGLADEVGTFDSALAGIFKAQSGRNTQTQGKISMSEETKSAPDANSAIYTQAQMDAAVTSAKAESATTAKAEGDKAVASARTEAATTERERVKSIMGLEETKGREAQAIAIATTTDLSADQAKAVLAASPAATSGARAGASSIGLVVDDVEKKQSAASGDHGWNAAVDKINKAVAPRR